MGGTEPAAAGAEAAEVGSPAFREALARRLAALPPAGGRRIALGQVVTGAGAPRAWTVVAGGDEPTVVLEGTGAAEVCLVTDEAAARRLLEGAPPAELLAAGQLKVRGDATALVEAQEALASLGAALRTAPAATAAATDREAR